MISKRKAAKRNVKGKGHTEDGSMKCGKEQCPLYSECSARHRFLTFNLKHNCNECFKYSKQWLSDNPEPSIESRIQEALLSPGFIDKVAEAVMKVQDKDAVCEATEHVIEYPYVGVTKYKTAVLITHHSDSKNDNNGTTINDESWYFGDKEGYWDDLKPFNGTITYKNGKPVKTEESKW